MGYFDGADETTLEGKPLPVLVDEGAPPRNIYLCTLETRQAVSSAGNDMVKVTSVVVEPEEFEGRRVFDQFLFIKDKWKSGGSHFDKTFHILKQIMGEEWVAGLDGDLVTEIIPTIVSALDDLQVGVQVGQREEEYQGKKKVKNSVREYHDAGQYGETGEE